MFTYIKKHRRGIIGTSIFHLIIVIFFILYKGFSTPLPLPDEEGILVNFGNTEIGQGIVEPPKEEVSSQEDIVEETVAEEQIEEVVEESIVPESPKEEILTQNTEEAPEVNAEEAKRKQEELEKKKLEEKRKKEAERIAELKRIAEKRRIDSLNEIKRIEQERKAAELRDKIAKGFSGNSNSEGISSGTGNQGKPDGDIKSNNYSGSGKGNGVDWSLKGRNPLSLPKPEYTRQEKGVIVVEVIVNQHGDVVEAVGGKKGSTITDNNLVKAAEKAALKAKFDTKTKAPPRQTGTITYTFILE